MAEIRFGHREGPGRGREMKIGAGKYIARRGGKFVKVLADGSATLCASADTVCMGWMEIPKDTAGTNSWTSAAGSKVFMIYAGDGNVFEIPANEAIASVNATALYKGAKFYL